LLKLDSERSADLDVALPQGAGILLPGRIRQSFNSFIGEDELEYLLCALELVGGHDWRLLPHYQYSTERGAWQFYPSANAHLKCSRVSVHRDVAIPGI